MSDDDRAPDGEDQWQRANGEYLRAALRWLRLRLDQLAGTTEPPAPATPAATQHPAPASPAAAQRRFRRASHEAPKLALPAGRLDDLDEAAGAMATARDMQPPPALHILGDRLGLSAFERHVLLLCAAVELDTGMTFLCARAQHDPERVYPTFALALALFEDAAWDVVSPERPLRYWRLIEINQPGARPLTASPLRADERIVNYLKGLNYLDDRLTSLLAPFDAEASESLAPSQEAAGTTIERTLRRAAEAGGLPPPIQLVGSDPMSKQLVAQRAARRLDLNLCRLPAELLPQPATELENLARLWDREQRLLPLALFVDAHELDVAGGGASAPAAALQRFMARMHGVILLSTREVRAGPGPAIHAVEVGKPSAAEQQAAWTAALDGTAGRTPALLAGQFDLNLPTIGRIARDAVPASQEPDAHRLWDACLANTAPRMERLARRLRPVATWDDMVLPDDEMRLLRQLAAQVAQRTKVYDEWRFRGRLNRGLGINALFAGESGTGKTMAAEVIANHLGLHLYRIDLSAVVSKYIGDTEKNLRQLFDAAEDGGAILFFDEADALFGKRSEVRDSHDRYANIEINYLLQRMESYRGLAILATNMRSALDGAFLRRLRFIVTFPFPARAQRKAIWQRAWTAETPLTDLDYDHLSRLNLAGGNIATVALNAAFAAADRGAAVTMPLVLDAARAEYRKLERPINDADFRWHEPSQPPRTEAIA